MSVGKTSQAKGRTAEFELSAILNRHGFDTRPGETMNFGGEPDIIGMPGVHVEVKRRENPDIPSALRQAAQDAEFFGDGLPAVFVRGNREAWRVVMTLKDWLRLYKLAGFAEREGTP